jgi:hypothetical protein
MFISHFLSFQQVHAYTLLLRPPLLLLLLLLLTYFLLNPSRKSACMGILQPKISNLLCVSEFGILIQSTDIVSTDKQDYFESNLGEPYTRVSFEKSSILNF